MGSRSRLQYETEGTLKVARARQRDGVNSYKGSRADLVPDRLKLVPDRLKLVLLGPSLLAVAESGKAIAVLVASWGDSHGRRLG